MKSKQDEGKKIILLDKNCRLVQTNGFMLDGVVTDLDPYGVMFQTKQKTSFIAWANIREITPLEDY